MDGRQQRAIKRLTLDTLPSRPLNAITYSLLSASKDAHLLLFIHFDHHFFF